MPGPEIDDIELVDVPKRKTARQRELEKTRQRVAEMVQEEPSLEVLQAAELALVALREPLEPGPVVILLRHVIDHLEAAMLRQDRELADLRRKLHERDEELRRLRREGGPA